MFVNASPIVSLINASNPSQDVIDKGVLAEPQSGVKVAVTPVAWSRKENVYVTSDRFKVGGPIRFKVSVILPEAREVFLTSPVRQNRPLLMKDGNVVPYKKGFYLNPECILVRVAELTVPANRPVVIDLFDSADFYEPLKPGEYQLTLSRILDTCEGEFYQSEPIKFWVLP
jgi:hypothetical protein